MTALDNVPPLATGADSTPPLRATRVPSLRESRELLFNLAMREIRGQYKRTTLGHLWSLINPLATMLMYTLVFSVILGANATVGHPSGLHNYALFLMAGLLPWSFFNGATVSGMGALLNNANLLNKVYFRRDVLVSSAVLSALVTLGFELSVLMVALLAFGGMPLPWIPLILVMIALLALFALGLGLLLSVINIYFRDTEHFVGIVFLLWFYLTPILYPVSLVANKDKAPRHFLGIDFHLLTIYRLNPMERFVSVFRSLFYDNAWPAWGDVGYCAGTAGVALVLGIWVFRRFEDRITEEL